MTSVGSGPTAFPIDFYIQPVKTHCSFMPVAQACTGSLCCCSYVHWASLTGRHSATICEEILQFWLESTVALFLPISSLVTLVITKIKIRIASLLCIFFNFINSASTVSSKPDCVLIIQLWFLYQHVDELSEGLVWASQGGCLEYVIFLLSTGVEVNSRGQVRLTEPWCLCYILH